MEDGGAVQACLAYQELHVLRGEVAGRSPGEYGPLQASKHSVGEAWHGLVGPGLDLLDLY